MTGEKEHAIYDAALQLFAERGYAGTAVPELAREAGVSVGTIYRYFKDKEALVNALYRRWRRTLTAWISLGLDPQADPRARFHHVWERLIGFARVHERALVFLELHHHATYLDAESRAMQAEIPAPLDGLFAGSASPAVRYAVFWGIYMGVVRAHWQGRLDLTATEIRETEDACWAAVHA